ncbi:MAG: xanthine dehydrogenase family protein subunit M [Chloroflexi bacterium]|nr:xanthine dehydrogenase family protein subunit M [Chloroflexota bacterium]MBT4073794.1 xanthine dehydrogenase family protein subunit M [Chloroflexota bacterium]MBT4515198.1 xanthine dehydrogenase family protein subunit M [Chloroflexota bacterium]MBT5320535.1 xanthine dehydrogenase family protein subunit M [Chloroflexota bacterium]MBT6683099.1 xanthine dehydrogenase family protein subunit M [Chloroflexota bacterium]
MPDFDFAQPTSLNEALELFAAEGEVRALVGGTDIVDQLKTGRRNADMVVDVKRIPELQRLEVAADGLHVGAARNLTDIGEFPAVRADYGGLADSSVLVGSWQIQNRAGLGGNVCNAAPSGDTIPALLSHDTTAIVASSTGRREIALSDFFAGPGQTVLQKGEILVELVLPPSPDNGASSYLRFIPRNEMDIAVVGVGSYLQLGSGNIVEKARIALASVAPTPVRARAAEEVLEGNVLTDDLIESAAVTAVEAATPITDVRGSAEYRRELVKVLTRRTLGICRDRING